MKHETRNSKRNVVSLTSNCVLRIVCLALGVLVLMIASSSASAAKRIPIAKPSPTPVPVSRAPVVENIHIGTEQKDDAVLNLVEGAVTPVRITGSLRTPDGCEALPADAVSAVFYRSSVDKGAYCSANDANCYRVPAESCRILHCYYPRMSPVEFTCDVPVQYYADTTVVGRHRATDWTAAITALNKNKEGTTKKKLVEMGAVVGVNIAEAVDYGAVALGAVSDVQELSVQNTGNVGLDLLLRAPEPLKCGGGEIPAGAAHVGLRPDTEYARALAIGMSALKIDLNLPPQNGAEASRRPLYLRLKVPDYGVSGQCTNVITSTGQIDEGWQDQ